MADLTAMLQAAAGAVGGDYEISRSLRFNSADSAYLSRTPASASNRKTWTWSGWVKKALIADNNPMLFTAGASSPYDQLYFDTNDKLNWYTGGQLIFLTSAVFRDPSAWYHIVLTVDTTQAVNADRVKLYVNNVSQTFSTYNGVTQNADTKTNNNEIHNIGRLVSALYYFNGYLTEINFIDGQALTPSSFGETNETTGVWSPIRYAGSYGTNGFYLNFSDNSGVTSTTLGKDQAGSNNWTPNNFSVTAGAGNDSLVDSPTRYGTDTGAGGEVRGNYCTLNPLDSVAGNLRNANLEYYDTSGNGEYAASTMSFDIATEKYYIEYAVGTLNYNFDRIGIIPESDTGIYNGTYASSHAYYAANGNKIPANTAFGNSINLGDILGIAVGNGQIEYFKNGVSQGVLASGLTGRYKFASSGAANTHGVYNFGQRPFAYTAPSGFKALCTTNLPDPTVVQGDDYFNTVLYTGTGSSLGVTGVGFQPDFVWIKERSGAADHGLYDAVRGVTKQLESSTTDAETTEATGLTAFGTDGFTVGALAQLNTSADTYVAWNWKANGAGSSNTAGTISSTVSVSTTSGFSIVTWTGGAGTVGHGLGVAPKMVIAKNRTTAQDWYVWFTGFTSSQYLVLNGTNAVGTSASLWNGTLPSSTVIGLDLGGTNDIVAYCFAEVEGFSKFGSYTGNGSADGPFVYTGFRPAWILFKVALGLGGESWTIYDTKRGTYNVMGPTIFANLSNAEATNNSVDVLSNGFKLRSNSSALNYNTATMIFAAFAENPFKNSLAR